MAYTSILDGKTGRTKRYFVHQSHATQALNEIEEKLRQALQLLEDRRTGARQPFLNTADRRAGPGESPAARGRPGAGSRLIAALREAAEAARKARDPSALAHLPKAPKRGRGRPTHSGPAGCLVIRRLALFWQESTGTPVRITRTPDGSWKGDQGALFVQDAASLVMGVAGGARPSLSLIHDILGTAPATDT
jgi:hypothetical protein